MEAVTLNPNMVIIGDLAYETILIPTIHWLLKDAQKGADIILSIITMILPWLIKRDD